MILFLFLFATHSNADSGTARNYLDAAQSFYSQGQYFRAARYAFAAQEEDPALESSAYSWTAASLIRAGLHQSSAYFYIKTLQSKDKSAIKRITPFAPEMLTRLGSDFLRPYLLTNTELSDYDERSRSAYLLSLAKDALLQGKEAKVVEYISAIGSAPKNTLATMYQTRATAYAIAGSSALAISDFKKCVDVDFDNDQTQRCYAGLARAYYQNKQYELADQAYDQISKKSIIWPEILFEQAWNAFAEKEFNRSLGKLVSYRSPALSFVYNPENDVLRAQSYLALCLYEDANKSINEFNDRYAKLGEDIKRMVESKSQDLGYFYNLGKQAVSKSIYFGKDFEHLLNRFSRSPSFISQVDIERAINSEIAGINRFSDRLSGIKNDPSQGFSGFLNKVLEWRKRAAIQLGGVFVLNSLLDYHSDLLSQFDKMSFVKLEMLKRAKDQLVYKKTSLTEQNRENVKPKRKDYQYFWTFNGEFWNDEIGDYVFDLASSCKDGEGS